MSDFINVNDKIDCEKENFGQVKEIEDIKSSKELLGECFCLPTSNVNSYIAKTEVDISCHDFSNGISNSTIIFTELCQFDNECPGDQRCEMEENPELGMCKGLNKYIFYFLV